MEAVANEAAPGGVQDLAPPGVEVGLGDSGQSPKLGSGSHDPGPHVPGAHDPRARGPRPDGFGFHGRRALVAVVVVVPVLVGLALAAASAAAGLVAAGIAQGWLGALGGDWPVNAGVLGLTVLAVGTAVVGLAALFGPAGAALGALLMVLVGNPLSGVSSAPELLPEPAGALGQLLPPGAGGSLLRSTAFFDGAGAARPLTMLGAWIVLGLALAGVAALRRRRRGAGAGAGPVAVP